MKKIIIKKGKYCLSEEALRYIHGKLYKYFISYKKPTFYNGNQIVDVPLNNFITLVKANNNEHDLNKEYLYSKVDLGNEYCTLLGNIIFLDLITNQYGKEDVLNKLVINAIEKLGVRASDNGCIFEIIDEQYFNFYEDYEDKKYENDAREQRRQYLIKNCEYDTRCALELRRDFGISIH